MNYGKPQNHHGKYGKKYLGVFSILKKDSLFYAGYEVLVQKIKYFEKFVKFSLVGVLNTIIGYGIFFILSFYVNYILALLIAHIIGVMNSYFWNRSWVFQSKKNKIIEFLKFYSVYGIMLLINIATLYYLVSIFEISPQVSQLIILPFITILTYAGHNYWSFKK